MSLLSLDRWLLRCCVAVCLLVAPRSGRVQILDMNFDLTTDHLALGPLLVQRLREKCDVISVECRYSFTAAVEAPYPGVYPVVFVYWAGDETIESSGEGTTEIVQQRWGVLLCVQNVATPNDPGSFHAEAGPLLSQLRQALSGWQPDEALLPLQRVRASQPPFYTPVRGFFPLEFLITFSIGD